MQPLQYIVSVLATLALTASHVALADTTTNKNTEDSISQDVADFSHLSDFVNAEAFQNYIDKHVNTCIDQTYGNTAAIPCFVGYELWDRELNKYYKLLIAQLPNSDQDLVRQSQRLWLEGRDKTIEVNSALLDRHYEDVQGTIYQAMRANDADAAIVPIIKQRALLLKLWYEREKQGKL